MPKLDRSTIVLMSSCFALGFLFGCRDSFSEFLFQLNDQFLADSFEAFNEKMSIEGTVICTGVDLAADVPISREYLVEKKVRQKEIPKDAIWSTMLVSGRRAKHDIPKGSIIMSKDLYPRFKNYQRPENR